MKSKNYVDQMMYYLRQILKRKERKGKKDLACFFFYSKRKNILNKYHSE